MSKRLNILLTLEEQRDARTVVDQCYMCVREESSREHVPPKCLFPERKDIGHSEYRKNLITVPSCEIHNSQKSKDDEFLMVSIAGVIGNNSIGYQHYSGKVGRALRRTSYRLLSKVFFKHKPINIEIEKNKFASVIVGTPDIDRLKRCFEHVSYGIFRHHFGRRFIGDIKIIPGFLISLDKNPESFKKFVQHKFVLELQGKPHMGENPDVFYYQFTGEDEGGFIGLKMCFYSGVDVYAAFKPNEAETPFNLGMELMNSGIKTVINLDGKEYEFN